MKNPLQIGDLLIEKPIVQGGMAVRISTAELAAAVSEEGGLGVIGASGMTPDELRREIRKARDLTSKPIGVNIMAAISAFNDLLKVCLEERVEAIFVGAGFSREFLAMVKQSGSKAIPIVSSSKAASIAERLSADAVVFESGEAGGHLGTDRKTFEVLGEIVSAVSIPVIAAGGMTKKEELERAFEMGASAVQLGTVFAASKESAAHADFKNYYIRAKSDDVVIIQSPAGLPGRALLNRFVKEVVFAGKTHTPKYIKSCIRCLKKCTRSFCILDALMCAKKGHVEEGVVFCGAGVENVRQIKSVKEILKDLGF